VRSSVDENSFTEKKTEDRAGIQLSDHRSAADGSIGE